MAVIQRAVTALAFKQHDDFYIMFDGIINFFAFLNSDISNKLRYNFCWIEDIVAQRRDEWHDKGVLGGFFRFNEMFLLVDLRGNRLQNFDKVHVHLPQWFDAAPFIGFQATNTSLSSAAFYPKLKAGKIWLERLK